MENQHSRGLPGLMQLARFKDLHPRGASPRQYTLQELRAWARRHRMGYSTLYRGLGEHYQLGWASPGKGEVGGRRRTVWVFWPLHLYRVLGSDDHSDLKKAAYTSGLSLQAADEELYTMAVYVWNVVETLSTPGLPSEALAAAYNPAVGVLWDWVDMIRAGRRRWKVAHPDEEGPPRPKPGGRAGITQGLEDSP